MPISTWLPIWESPSLQSCLERKAHFCRPYLKVVLGLVNHFKTPLKRPYQTTEKAYHATLKLRPDFWEA